MTDQNIGAANIELIESRDWGGICLTVEGTDMEDGQWIMAEEPVEAIA